MLTPMRDAQFVAFFAGRNPGVTVCTQSYAQVLWINGDHATVTARRDVWETFLRKGRRTVSRSDADGPAPGAPVSPEEQARQGTEVSYATAKLRADVARQQMRLAKDQLKRARKRFKEARREARRARKLADIARRAWKKAKRRKRKEGKPAAVENPPTTGGSMKTGAGATLADEGSSKKSAGHRAGGKRGSNGKKQNPVSRLTKTRKAGAGARRAR